jgi:RNA 2',3'-cyclic 3'-phosphodiesterase
MPEQILLPGFEPEPALTDRIFFAVLPDAAAIEPIKLCTRGMRAQYSLRGRSIIAGRLHVSLLGIGDFAGIPTDFVKLLNVAASRVEMSSFDVTFDRALSFSGARQRPLVLIGDKGVEEMKALQQALITELQRTGLPLSNSRSFTPHLTLLYSSQKMTESSIESVGWTVREFVLVHSLLGKNKPYATLGRWHLS